MRGLGLTVMLLAMAVWACGYRVLHCVFATVGKLILVVHFEVWRSIHLSEKRSWPFAQFATAIGSDKYLSDDIRVANVNLGCGQDKDRRCVRRLKSLLSSARGITRCLHNCRGEATFVNLRRNKT